MINDTFDTPPTSTNSTEPKPLLTFPELDSHFSTLPAGAADATLTTCLSRLQQLPVDESSPDWATGLGLTLPWLLAAGQSHSQEVLDTLAERLAHWTIDRFLHSDTIAAEIVVTLAQHQPRTMAVAGRAIVNRLLQGLQKQQALPAWTATLIGQLRQVADEPGAATLAQATLAALPDWQVLLRRDAFEQALTKNDRNELLMLVGHFSLLSLIDLRQMPQQPLGAALANIASRPPIAPDMQAAVANRLEDERVRLHWLLTPLGTQSIEALLAKASEMFPTPAYERIRQEIVLSLARHAAIQQSALQGAEAVLLICQLHHLMGGRPDAWGPVWTAVRQLARQVKLHGGLATPATDRSRTVNTLLCQGGLTGALETVGWRLALLKHSGLSLLDCLGQLVQQVPCSPNGQPLLARVLQVTRANAQEHQQALLEMCSAQGLPVHAGAQVYTRQLLLRARLLALAASQETDPHQLPEKEENILLETASQFTPGVLMLGLLRHLHVELRFPDWSQDGALWLMAQLQASVAALPTGVPTDWALQICTQFDDDLAQALPPAHYQQWSAWLRTL
ncbi:hypothetical protein [Hydrogenophaga sp.]|uniref:hypothetical protein n=1 Tax=Hydrogenophaga sp. TaxID=1904254 RepID=UPI0035B4A444